MIYVTVMHKKSLKKLIFSDFCKLNVWFLYPWKHRFREFRTSITFLAGLGHTFFICGWMTRRILRSLVIRMAKICKQIFGRELHRVVALARRPGHFPSERVASDSKKQPRPCLSTLNSSRLYWIIYCVLIGETQYRLSFRFRPPGAVPFRDS